MTDSEYREVEQWLDDALRVFERNRGELTPNDRVTYDNLMSARRELHELRLDEEI